MIHSPSSPSSQHTKPRMAMRASTRRAFCEDPPVGAGDDITAGRLRPGMTFNEKVWALTARIPAGRVTTYGEIARALDTNACRAVGQALGRNPYAPAVPCHRVVGHDGRLTGFAGGLDAKQRLLAAEGVTITNGRVSVADRFVFQNPAGS